MSIRYNVTLQRYKKASKEPKECEKKIFFYVYVFMSFTSSHQNLSVCRPIGPRPHSRNYAYVGRNSVSSIGQNQSLTSLLNLFRGKVNHFFLKLSPFSSNLCAVCTILSRMASAAVEFDFIMSYQFATGSWLTMMVDFMAWRSSIRSRKSSICCLSRERTPKSSMMSRSVSAILLKNWSKYPPCVRSQSARRA